MKRLLLVLPLLALTACGTPKITGYDGPKALDRHGVIEASRSCINTRMKPQIVYLSQKTEHGITPVPVDVQCEVYGPTFTR